MNTLSMQLFGKIDKRQLPSAPPAIKTNTRITKTTATAMKLYSKRDKTKDNTSF